jgi:hypothetical protein
MIDSSPIGISTQYNVQRSPDLSFDGTNYLAVWEDLRNNNSDLYGSFVTPQGVVLNPNGILITAANSIQANCAIAFDGVNYLVVWDDYRSGYERDIYASRVTVHGQVLDSAGFCIAGGFSDQTIPDVAFDGENYLVVWRDSSAADPGDIYCARVSPGGSVIGNYPVTIMPGLQTEPSLTRGDNGQILILWSGYLDSLNHKPVKAMRIWGKMYPFTQIDETTNGLVPVQGLLLEIMPNPVIGNAVIYAAAGRGQTVKSLKIYDNLGRCVRSFVLSDKVKTLVWDGRENKGWSLPCGVYFCRLDDGDESIIKKIIKLK